MTTLLYCTTISFYQLVFPSKGQGIRHRASVLTDLGSEILRIRCLISSTINKAMVLGVLSVCSIVSRFSPSKCGKHMMLIVLDKIC